VFTSCIRRQRGLFLRLPRGASPGLSRVDATSRPPLPSGAIEIVVPRLCRGRPRDRHVDATSRSPLRSGAIAVLVPGYVAGTLGTARVDATSRLPPRSVAIEVVVSGCVAVILGTVDAPATLPSLRISRGHQELLTGHLRERLPDHLRMIFGIISGTFGSSSGSRSDHLRITFGSSSDHVRIIFGITFGSSSGSRSDHLRHSLRIICARASDVFTEYHRDVLGSIYAASFASIGRLGTGRRRRTGTAR
jgi:hypothetical protein